jgi:glycosyltransferase involved in cell wall biosynthesis
MTTVAQAHANSLQHPRYFEQQAFERLRIVHVAESFGAGVLSVLASIVRYQAALGHEVHVIHSVRVETPRRYDQMFDHRVKLHPLQMASEISLQLDISALVSLSKVIGVLGPDVVHLHSSKAGFIGRIATWLMRTPSVFYSPHGISFLRQDISTRKQKLYAALEWCASRFGGVVIACSNSERWEIQRRINPGTLVLVENGIDNCCSKIKRHAVGAYLRIGTAGRITAAKNPQVFARLAESLPSHKFVWIGDGTHPDRKRLKDAAVSITGWMDRDAALSRMAELDIYVQPSLWEGMPLSVIEAMSAGIPIVVTDCSGNRDVVTHGETGFIAKNECELLSYVEMLAKSPELRERIGTRARKVALERYSSERMNRELLSLYRTAVLQIPQGTPVAN